MNRNRIIVSVMLAFASSTMLAAEPAVPTNTETTAKPAANSVKASTNKPGGSQLGMSVTGTQEAPKVLYIVPWKTLDAVPAEPYVSGLLDEVFSPVDPVVFERSVRHHEQIQTAAPEAVVEQ